MQRDGSHSTSTSLEHTWYFGNSNGAANRQEKFPVMTYQQALNIPPARLSGVLTFLGSAAPCLTMKLKSNKPIVTPN